VTNRKETSSRLSFDEEVFIKRIKNIMNMALLTDGTNASTRFYPMDLDNRLHIGLVPPMDQNILLEFEYLD
jgi:hypothetical protein